MRNSFRIVAALIICTFAHLALADSGETISVYKLNATLTGMSRDGRHHTIWMTACLMDSAHVPLANLELVLRGGAADKHLATNERGCMSWQEQQILDDPLPETITLKRQVVIWPDHGIWSSVISRGEDFDSIPLSLVIPTKDLNRPETAAVDNQ